jgi:hypothetical protein
MIFPTVEYDVEALLHIINCISMPTRRHVMEKGRDADPPILKILKYDPIQISCCKDDKC